MKRLLITIILLWAANFSVLAAVYPGPNTTWLVVASRSTPNEAINLAKSFPLSPYGDGVGVFRSSNGWYGVTLGWSSVPFAKRVLADLQQRKLIPQDSYLHSGKRFIELVWSVSGTTSKNTSTILSATKLAAQIDRPTQSTKIDHRHNGPGYVSGLTSGSELSFRARPTRSAKELRRLSTRTTLQITGKLNGWYNVRLNNGQTGWVYGQYVSQGIPPKIVVEAPKPPSVVPQPQIVVSDADNGLKLKISGAEKQSGGYVSLLRNPGEDQLEIARLRENTKLTVTGKYKDWYRVSPAPSVEGWVESKFVVAGELLTFGPPKPEATPETPETKEPEIDTASKDPVAGEADKPSPAIGKRVALVLGNSSYKHTTELPNPKNDADSISKKLKDLGFKVIVGLDGTKAAMELSIREFVRELPNSEAALFFYAGHAMQAKGKNYLIPIDAKLEDSTAIDFETIQLSSILQFVDQPGRVSIALLDACRDNPLSRRFARSLGATRTAFIGRGLATPSSTGNLLIGFATAPGEVALDGEGDNSPFTTALLKHMGTPNLEIEAMLKLVRSDVFTLTEKRQSPWVNSGLRKNFFLKN